MIIWYSVTLDALVCPVLCMDLLIWGFITPCISHLENINSLSYADILDIDIFQFIIQVMLMNPIIDLFKSIFKCWEAIMLMLAGFPKF